MTMALLAGRGWKAVARVVLYCDIIGISRRTLTNYNESLMPRVAGERAAAIYLSKIRSKRKRDGGASSRHLASVLPLQYRWYLPHLVLSII